MPLKTSKQQNIQLPWKVASDCSESDLASTAKELAGHLQLGDRVLLEGPMGVGKTTFTRSLLLGLGVVQPPEGSPTFAIAHEYQAPRGGVVHIDFYRIKAESEIEEAGIFSYYWERNLIVISEWLSSWPDFESAVLNSGQIWKVQLSFDEESDSRRIITIQKISKNS